MTSFRLPMLAAALAIATGITVAPAVAKDHSWQVGNDQFHVYYRDLDMTSATGRATMLGRIEAAATKLCEARMTLRVDVDACVKQVVAETAPRSAMLRLALSERSASRYAAR